MAEVAEPITRYKALCIDVTDERAGQQFWSEVLGLEISGREAHRWLAGETSQQVVWINEVPEPKTVKNRVHLDVFANSVDELLALGARRLADFPHWTVMAAPDGQEFCAFVRDDPPRHRLKDVVVDSQDPERIARWWQSVLGGVLDSDPDNSWWWLDGIAGAPFESIDFVPVPEPKTAKNRVHWDVLVDDFGLLVDAGARVLRPKGGDISWHVMADPDGNEFCAFDD
jgi:catechol 2,3-dioxygenase-like lactoylglutathione lyase family enzyme